MFGMRGTNAKLIRRLASNTGLEGRHLRTEVKRLKRQWNQTPANQRFALRTDWEKSIHEDRSSSVKHLEEVPQP